MCSSLILLWKYSRNSMFVRHPNPNAGIMRIHRTTVADGRCRVISVTLSLAAATLGRLYKSRPSRCTGVAISCDKTGTTICVITVLECGSAARLSGITPAQYEGSVKEPEMVIPSRKRNMAVPRLENGRVGTFRNATVASLLQLLNSCAKRISFHTPSGTLMAKVEPKTMGSRAGDVGIVSLVMVSAPLATA